MIVPHNDDSEEELFWEDTAYLYEEIQELEKSLEREKDKRNEDKFLFCLVSVILLNVIIFTSMEESFMGPLVIGIFEAFALLLLAHRWGLEKIVKMIDGLIATISRKPDN